MFSKQWNKFLILNNVIFKELFRIRTRCCYIILYAIILHIIWGITLLFSSAPQGVTAINTISRASLHNSIIEGIFLIFVGILAYIGLGSRSSIRGILFLIPQQLALMMSAAGAIIAITNGYFADGEPRPRMFIMADQCPAILVASLHTIALIHWHLWSHKCPTGPSHCQL